MKRFILLLLFPIPIITAAQKNDSSDTLLFTKIGVVSTSTLSLPQISIRCGTTLTTSNQPLIILDNIVLAPGNLSAINPNTIETITILKDDKAASLYGSAARSGVILITLKKQNIVIKDKETGQPVSNGSVKIKVNNRLLELAADSNGMVHLGKENLKAVRQIEVSSIGYETAIQNSDWMDSATSKTVLLTRKNAKLDEVVIVSYSATSCGRSCSCYVKCTRVYPALKFTSQQYSSKLSVYPIPVNKGGLLTIVAKEGIGGEYHIFSTAGALVHSGVITAVDDQPFSIAIGSYPPGSYILRLTNRTTGSLLTQKIVVQ